MKPNNSNWSRRDFFARTSCAALGMAAVSSSLKSFGLINAMATENAASDYRALVCIFLAGGNDANNMVVPLDATGYGQYTAARNSAGLALGQGQLHSITPTSINSPYGLHTSFVNMQSLFNQQKLALVTNVGPLVRPLTRAQYRSNGPRPYQLFSHDDQSAQWETSRSDVSVQTGWGGLVADRARSLNNSSAFPIVTSVSGTTVFAQGVATRPLVVAAAPTPLNQVFVLSGFNTSPESIARQNTFDFLRTIDRTASLISATSDTTQQAVDIKTALSIDPAVATTFPNTSLGNQLKQVAKIIRLNQLSLGLNRQIFFCQIGGFDTHQNELGSHTQLYSQIDAAMKAFYDETVVIGVDSSVTTFTLSDFGRTFQPSGNGAGVGTDHGWGNHHLVMGGAVLGQDFYGVRGSNGTVFPTLQLSGPDDTDDRGRWIPTSSVEQYAGTLATWFGLTPADLAVAFPNIGQFTTPNLGFMMP